jgi:hypothetical protein
MSIVSDLDQFVRRTFESFYLDLCGMESCGREREAVSRYVFAHLVKCCQPGTVLYDSAQIGIEVAVRQLERCEEYPNVGKDVCKDVVIWREPNTVLWKANLRHFEPLAIMEWKMIHAFDTPRDRKRKPDEYESDIRWLGNKARAVGAEFVGYAVFVDSTYDPKKLVCARMTSDEMKLDWLTLSVSQTSGQTR